MKRVIISICLLFGLVGATSVNALSCNFGFIPTPDIKAPFGCVKDPASRWWVYQSLENRLADYKYEINKIEALKGLLEDDICIGCDVAGEDLSGVNCTPSAEVGQKRLIA